MIRAALFDFGGVILTSPFEAFAHYERERGLPEGFIRELNASNPDANAWARLERSEVSIEEFCELYEEEARSAGGQLVGMEVIGLLGGEVRPEMVEAVKRCKERLITACLTNNFVVPELTAPAGQGPRLGEEAGDGAPRRDRSTVMALFDAVIESSKLGVRKPDPGFYELACQQLAIEPAEAVFLDDLGVNLKPARAMGMTTIKVVDAAQAIADLEAVVGFPLR